MPCDHVGGPELIEMAEERLHAENIPETAWPGRRFRWSENPEDGMWASIVIEVERRGDQWIVVRLDRKREKVEEVGFREVGGA
jgi:hypothetical protein